MHNQMLVVATLCVYVCVCICVCVLAACSTVMNSFRVVCGQQNRRRRRCAPRFSGRLTLQVRNVGNFTLCEDKAVCV